MISGKFPKSLRGALDLVVFYDFFNDFSSFFSDFAKFTKHHTEFGLVRDSPGEISKIGDKTFFSALLFSNFFFLIWIEDQILRILASLLFRYHR